LEIRKIYICSKICRAWIYQGIMELMVAKTLIEGGKKRNNIS
jgi:hypothetical protein